jgi:hypothetical protein
VLSAAALLLVPPHAAEARNAPAAAFIAGAKAMPLSKFSQQDHIKDLKVEAWLKQRVGAKGRIMWRRTSCRAKAGDRDIVNSPICVEAVIRYPNGVSIIVGIGFDRRAERPEQHPDAMWGSLAVKGRGCEFLRHPDYIDAALTSIDETIKAGRCQ